MKQIERLDIALHDIDLTSDNYDPHVVEYKISRTLLADPKTVTDLLPEAVANSLDRLKIYVQSVYIDAAAPIPQKINPVDIRILNSSVTDMTNCLLAAYEETVFKYARANMDELVTKIVTYRQEGAA